MTKFGFTYSLNLSAKELLGVAAVGATWVGALALTGTPVGLMTLGHFAAASGITGGLWTGAKALGLVGQALTDKAAIKLGNREWYETDKDYAKEKDVDAKAKDRAHEFANNQKATKAETNGLMSDLAQGTVKTFSAAYNYTIGNALGSISIPFTTKKEAEIERNFSSYKSADIANMEAGSTRSGKKFK